MLHNYFQLEYVYDPCFFWYVRKKSYQLCVINPFNPQKQHVNITFLLLFIQQKQLKYYKTNANNRKAVKGKKVQCKKKKNKKTIPFHGQRLCKPRYFRRNYCESTIPDCVIPEIARLFNPGLFNPKLLPRNFQAQTF